MSDGSGGGYEFSVDWFSTHIPVWNTIIAQVRPQRVLEIGSYEGRSAVFMIERCGALGPVELTAIDTWQGGVEHDASAMNGVERRFDRNVALARSRAAHAVTLNKLKGESLSALAGLIAAGRQESFDFIYIDGSHQAPDVLADAVLAFPLLRVKGVMVFDDYLWTNEQPGAQDPLNMPKPAIDAFINLYQRRLRVVQDTPLRQLYVLKTA